jgi:hypothetical protein
VDERVRARVDPGLRRELDSPGGYGAVGPFDEVDLLEDRRQETGDLGS